MNQMDLGSCLEKKDEAKLSFEITSLETIVLYCML